MKTRGRVDEGDPELFFGRDELKGVEWKVAPSANAPFCPVDIVEGAAAQRDPVMNFFTNGNMPYGFSDKFQR